MTRFHPEGTYDLVEAFAQDRGRPATDAEILALGYGYGRGSLDARASATPPASCAPAPDASAVVEDRRSERTRLADAIQAARLSDRAAEIGIDFAAADAALALLAASRAAPTPPATPAPAASEAVVEAACAFVAAEGGAHRMEVEYPRLRAAVREYRARRTT